MGLGPPVCQHCMVIARAMQSAMPVDSSKLMTSYNHTFYRCPVCGNLDLKLTAFQCDLKQLEDNEAFYNFVLNKEK